MLYKNIDIDVCGVEKLYNLCIYVHKIYRSCKYNSITVKKDLKSLKVFEKCPSLMAGHKFPTNHVLKGNLH